MTTSMVYEDYDYVTPTNIAARKFWDYFGNSSESDANIPGVGGRDQGPVLATYAGLLVFGAFGNLAVLAALTKAKRKRSRVDLLMTHLAVADVSVTCGVIPLEIGWKYTNAWLAGNLLCKFFLVIRAFGLYLSSNVLVCISLDRFFAVVYPLRVEQAARRNRHMLLMAWMVALACSLPQSVVFRVKQHPNMTQFEQCVSFDAFSSKEQEVVYNVFCLCAMYFLPLIIITCCYLCIFLEIRRNSKELDDKYMCNNNKGPCNVRLRRSDHRVFRRARQKTLRMTVVIVSVFATSWGPYVFMAMWYMIDRPSAEEVPSQVQDFLFAFAVSNSCLNPLVYGTFTLNIFSTIRRVLRKSCCSSSTASDSIGNSGSSTVKNKHHNVETPLTTIKNGRVRPRLGVRFADTSLTNLPDRLDSPRPRKPS